MAKISFGGNWCKMCPEWNSDGLKWVGLRNYLKCELKKTK